MCRRLPPPIVSNDLADAGLSQDRPYPPSSRIRSSLSTSVACAGISANIVRARSAARARTAGVILARSASNFLATKTAAGMRDVRLLPPALEALRAQRTQTELLGGEIFHDDRTNAPWSGDQALRLGPWRRALRTAGVRYR